MATWILLRRAVLVVLMCWFTTHVAGATDVRALGPYGGDVRHLAYAPDDPNRIFLGTSSGRLYVSNDGGLSWSQFAHLGNGYDYVLDNISIDPRSPHTMYVAVWSIERNTGELFRTGDAGRTWTSLAGMAGKSIRSLAMAPSDSRILVAGTLNGVFRSTDGGDSWKQISPANHADIRNIQSVAIDPWNPEVVYVGTWHLAWKTPDAGGSWKQIHRGMIDDSDVFSIIIDRKNPTLVYASACSGIYKSENAGELFSKVQGIPFSARRTRVLKQDPNRPEIVYAGTTEGLWRTMSAGRQWQRISAPNLIINDVLIDPRDSDRVLLATDRTGVLLSTDGGRSFVPSNQGFSHRQITALLVDHKAQHVLYAGVVNDKEFGGVFVSRDDGAHWSQMSVGLGGEDVFALAQDKAGLLYAGTNRGLFCLDDKRRMWVRIFPQVRERSFRVNALVLTDTIIVAAGPNGIARSQNSGRTWVTQPYSGTQPFMAVHATGNAIVAATHGLLLTSPDGGRTWSSMQIPPVSYIRDMVLDRNAQVWIATPQGAFFRNGLGTWDKARGLAEAPKYLSYESKASRMLAVSASNTILATSDGEHWKALAQLGPPVRTLLLAGDRVFVGTAFDGVVSLTLDDSVSVSLGGGGAQK